MKKLVSILALAVALSVSANAQTVLGNYLSNLGGSSASSAVSTISEVVSGLTGVVYSAPVSLNGTYNYNGVAVSASSSEGGIVANLAGTAVTSGIEAKADEYLAKVGIKPGVMTWTFNQDNTFTLNVGGISLPGKYKVGDGEKTITLTFGKTMQYLCMTGVLETAPGGAKMLFTADKAMALFKKLASQLGEASSKISAIGKLADGYDTFRLGFKLSK